MHRVSRAIIDSKYLRPDGAMATRYDDFVGVKQGFAVKWILGFAVSK
jgi:hypothetical protein